MDEGAVTLRAEFEARRGLLDLTMNLEGGPGATIALLGPNGAGKTTVLRCLAGLLPITSGRIEIGDRVVDDNSGHVRPEERPVGMVFQDYLLFPHLSVLENVAFGLRARGANRTQARARAMLLLERFELSDRAQERPTALSGGQAQRVALARALATSPQLLLLDEPLSALDARTRLTVRAELRRHLAAFPGSTVLVSHDPVDAMALADRVVVVEEGRVVQAGTPAEVAGRPRTDYVARLVGLSLLPGTGEGTTVRLDGGGAVAGGGGGAGPGFLPLPPESV